MFCIGKVTLFRIIHASCRYSLGYMSETHVIAKFAPRGAHGDMNVALSNMLQQHVAHADMFHRHVAQFV